MSRTGESHRNCIFDKYPKFFLKHVVCRFHLRVAEFVEVPQNIDVSTTNGRC